MRTAARRRYERNRARLKREVALQVKMRTATTCPRKQGTGICGGALSVGTDRIGRTIVVCEKCERRKRGICRDCPAPVYGALLKATRCNRCAVRAARESMRRSAERNRQEILARARERYSDPDLRRRRNEYKRLYRLAHPEKVREQKRRYIERRTRRYLEYHRRYNAMAKRQQRKRDQAREAYYRDNPIRPSPVCQHCHAVIPWTPLPGGRAGAPPKNCDQCCSKYELARRIARRATAAAVTQRGAPEPPKRLPGIRVRRPQPARYAQSGERLCATPRCDIVVTHRKKKCTRCREREAAAARELIARNHHGRGRRTDLERAG